MKNALLIVLLFGLSIQAKAQHSVNGTVTDANNEPLFGVTVLEKGTATGTITDISGTFSISVSTPDATLIFSYTGFEEQEVTLNGNSEVHLSLESGITLGEIQVVGSRNYNRSSTNSPVPIDVIDVSELAASSGKPEINQILQYAAPSFNATKQSGSDGADHIDPASLRGLGPDQTLVLVNGKRRHQSSLVNVFGTRGRGNTGTDLNALPASAIKRIEILRDGASAQYGSDAIAGVINIVLKDKTDGISGGLTYGLYSTAVGEGYAEESDSELWNVEGTNRLLDGNEDKSFDGETKKIDLNYGVALGQDGGYANFTTEFLSKDRTLRPGFSWRKGYGSAAVDGFNFMVNAAMPLGENIEAYAFGGRNYRDTDAFAFSRGAAYDDERTVPSLYPDGFTPRITSIITDASVSAGLRHTTENGWKVDFNNSYGKNHFHYFIKGSNNASLMDASPTDFDAGGHSLAMNTTSLDFSKYYEDIAAGFNLAFGLEYRTENFEIFAGEEASYATYDVNGNVVGPTTDPNDLVVLNDEEGNPIVDLMGNTIPRPGGSQGFPGYSPGNVVDRNRSNFGGYIDAELNLTEAFLLGGAVRYETYSDFGRTFNYKLASRYKISDQFSLRGSISSGFRAPSLAQIYYNLIFNDIVGGTSVRTLLSSNTSTVTRAFGIGALKEETAFNGSFGFTFKAGNFSATIDAYSISVNDRIVLTDKFEAGHLGVGAEKAQFFANGVDTKTQGIDFVVNYKTHFGNNQSFAVALAGNINDTDIESINTGEQELNEYVFFGPFSRAYLEAAAPDYKFGLNFTYATPKFNAQISLTQFSEVILQDFQWVENTVSNAGEAEIIYGLATDTYEAAMTMDVSLSYNLSDNLKLTLGGNNILNTYPTPQFDGWTDQGGFNDSVQMGSDGAYFFGRVGVKF